MMLGGMALLLQPQPIADLADIGVWPLRLAGVVLLALVVAYVVLAFTVHGQLSIRQWKLEMPAAWIATSQLAIGTLNFLCVSAALHALVASVSDATFLRVATAPEAYQVDSKPLDSNPKQVTMATVNRLGRP